VPQAKLHRAPHRAFIAGVAAARDVGEVRVLVELLLFAWQLA
jgi:hypothetical protein